MTGRLITGDCRAVMAAMPPGSVDLVFGSPPYPNKAVRYGDKAFKLGPREWVEFMLEVYVAAVHACRGWVLFVVNNPVIDGRYEPAVEQLLYRLPSAGVAIDRPCIWHKNAPPNRHVGAAWYANAWEYIIAGRRMGGKARPIDWEAIATPAKFKAGGHFRQRGADGKRRRGSDYPTGKLAYPRDVFYVTVGGGHMGHALASENEAPFPEKLVTPFVLSLSAVGETILDPFGGSGTVASVAFQRQRSFISIDDRASQSRLTARRLKSVGCIDFTTEKYPHPVSK